MRFNKSDKEDIGNLKQALSFVSKEHPIVLDFLKEICYYNAMNTAKDTNEHMMISGAKNVYQVIKDIMREDVSAEDIANKFKRVK